MKTKQTIAEFGDFQTPPKLASAVCILLARQGVRPVSLLEPTCGRGSFLAAGLKEFRWLRQSLGADINGAYVREARAVLDGEADRVRLVEADFFITDWKLVLANLPDPLLVLGNLPWVTNAYLGGLGSQNLPTKSNLQRRSGLDALTGKANFDISEWMLLQLIGAMTGRSATLAMLCKASVARKVLQHAWRKSLPVDGCAIYGIDTSRHFGAAVDAVLLVARFGSTPGAKEAKVYPCLSDAYEPATVGFHEGAVLADLEAYRRWQHLGANGPQLLRWRSGVKHDCARVMELVRDGRGYRNGFGVQVELENDYLYPMLKSSDVATHGGRHGRRYMLVTQRSVGEPTASIKERAPRTWAYLTTYSHLLIKRASSIYRDRPLYSVFGVGNYTFAPWKVAISGFYKSLNFVPCGPVEDKPIVLDDTSYFVPCDTKAQADYLLDLLHSGPAQAFYNAFIFWDNKRPITAETLARMDLRLLARELGSEGDLRALFGRSSESVVPGADIPASESGRPGWLFA